MPASTKARGYSWAWFWVVVVLAAFASLPASAFDYHIDAVAGDDGTADGTIVLGGFNTALARMDANTGETGELTQLAEATHRADASR